MVVPSDDTKNTFSLTCGTEIGFTIVITTLAIIDVDFFIIIIIIK